MAVYCIKYKIDDEHNENQRYCCSNSKFLNTSARSNRPVGAYISYFVIDFSTLPTS